MEKVEKQFSQHRIYTERKKNLFKGSAGPLSG